MGFILKGKVNLQSNAGNSKRLCLKSLEEEKHIIGLTDDNNQMSKVQVYM